MMRADAFVSGVTVAMCAAGVAQVASLSGEMAMLSPKKESEYSFTPEREYHIVSQRRRGFYKKRRSDF